MYFTFSLNHCGGLLLRWWRDNFAGEQFRSAEGQGVDAYQFMDAQLPDGPAPVMFLPHLNGSGTPLCDLQSKGALVGLTLATRRPDIFKAILEGLAFELRANLERLAACGLALEQLVAVGGGARSRPWLQLKADILNRPLRTLECHEAACLGAALLAGTAAGAYANLVEAVAQTVRSEREFQPVHERTVAYAGRYALFQQLCPALRELNQSL
jgi:xylulokinase